MGISIWTDKDEPLFFPDIVWEKDANGQRVRVRVLYYQNLSDAAVKDLQKFAKKHGYRLCNRQDKLRETRSQASKKAAATRKKRD